MTVTVAPALLPPGPPAQFTAIIDGARVTFTWSAPAVGGPVASYQLLAGSSPAFSAPLVSLPLPPAPASLTLAGVPSGSYFVRLLALNAAGASAPSDEISVVTTRPLLPGPPLLRPPAVAGSAVWLSWSSGTGGAPSSYVLLASAVPGGAPIVSVRVAATAYSVADVPAGTYYLRVVASNAIGSSAPSNEVTLIVP
jgi:hypothetical protein